MAAKRVLITGGAGFIGSHLADRLLARGDRVRILDNLEPQIHPHGKPDYVPAQAEFIHGDVRDRNAFARALESVDAVIHLAAAVGTGQSMYQIRKYADVNVGGLSTLLDILAETQARPKVIFPGSATSYGECAHRCPEHGVFFPELRPLAQLQQRQWDVLCPQCHATCDPVPIPEHQPLRPKFVYGIHKKVSEELLHAVGEAYDIPYTILRFFNVYGPRQSLSNPYTGVIPIFSSRIQSGKPPVVIEDGNESRDFVWVQDVVSALQLAVDNDAANRQTFNVGTGERTRIVDIAHLLLQLHASSLQPDINHEFRKHDFRHSVADISAIQKTLGYRPTVRFADGMRELFSWMQKQESVDFFDRAYRELQERGMINASAQPLSQPKVAAVILNWNGFDNTVECVQSLQNSGYSNLHIVVADNGSKNNEAQRLQQTLPDVTVLANEKNLGVAGGNNTGLRFVLNDPSFEYVIMMNNDLMVAPGAIHALVRPAQTNTHVGMVASRMMNYFRRDEIDNAGIFLLTSGLGYNRKSEAMPLFCPCSGFGLYRTQALQDIRMPNDEVWDDDYFAYVDELDVGFRVRMTGYTAAYADDAVAYHKDGASSGGPASDFSIYHGHRNNVWFILKDFPLPMLLRHLPSILATQLGTFVLYARRGRLRLVLKAKWDAVRRLKTVLRKRRAVQRMLKVPMSSMERSMVRRVYVQPEVAPMKKIQRAGQDN